MNPYVIPGISTPIEAACEFFNVDKDELLGPSRKRELVIPRCLLMFYYFKIRKYNDSSAAKLLNRHRTTVLYSYNTYKRDMQTDKEYRDNARKFFKRVV